MIIVVIVIALFLVIAVYSLCCISGKMSRLEEEQQLKRANDGNIKNKADNNAENGSNKTIEEV